MTNKSEKLIHLLLYRKIFNFNTGVAFSKWDIYVSQWNERGYLLPAFYWYLLAKRCCNTIHLSAHLIHAVIFRTFKNTHLEVIFNNRPLLCSFAWILHYNKILLRQITLWAKCTTNSVKSRRFLIACLQKPQTSQRTLTVSVGVVTLNYYAMGCW